MTYDAINTLVEDIDLIFLLIGAAILLIEIVEMMVKGTFRRKTLFEMGASLSTQIPSVLVNTVLLTGGYTLYYVAAEAISWSIPLTWWGLAAGVLVADFIYYWEHRIAHEVRLLWTQHAVHHSSRDMNIITAVRFGPFEGVWAVIVHVPMILMGFSAEVAIGAQIVVLERSALSLNRQNPAGPAAPIGLLAIRCLKLKAERFSLSDVAAYGADRQAWAG